MLGIIGKKLGMTQIFDEQGQQIPCTVVEAKPNPVVQVLENEYDKSGYRAVQLGYGSQRVRRESKKGERTRVVVAPARPNSATRRRRGSRRRRACCAPSDWTMRRRGRRFRPTRRATRSMRRSSRSASM
jgi:hypothetical protein